MTKSSLIALSIALMSFTHTSSAAGPSVAGVWQTEPADSGGHLHVQIEPCGNKMCGTIKAAIDGEGANVDDYEHLGKPMIVGMIEKGPGSYAKGTIWAPDKDKTYKSKMKLTDSGKLIVKGCVAFVCRSQTWTRVDG